MLSSATSIHSSPPNLGGLGDAALSGMGHCFDILEKRSACHISRTNNVHCFQFKEMLALIK